MEIFDTDKYCIITPLSSKLGKRETERLTYEIQRICTRKIGLDLSYVKDCTIDFIEQIKNIEFVELFNIPSDIFALITSMNLDKSLKLYVSELDFINNAHQLLNRKFTIV